MAIRTADDIKAEIEAGKGQRGTSGQTTQDIIDSLSVGGILHGITLTQAVTADWEIFTAFDTASDVKGVVADLPTGKFTLSLGADGPYAATAVLTLVTPASGLITIAPAVNGALVDFYGRNYFISGQAAQVVVLGFGQLVATNYVQLAIKGSGVATVDVTYSQFRLQRT